MTTDKVGTLVPSVHQINHLELLTMSVDLNAELNAFRAMIVTLKDDIIRQRDAVSISSINTHGSFMIAHADTARTWQAWTTKICKPDAPPKSICPALC